MTNTYFENKTIGQIVTKHPELVRVFMKYNVDFCCGGDRLVMEAIERDTDDVAALLEDARIAMENMRTVDSGKTLDDYTTEALVDRIIQTHHKYLRETLPKGSELLFKLLSVHGENHAELYEIHKLYGALKTELESHMIKEEVKLFPKLLIGGQDCKGLIAELELEHDGAGDILHALTDLTDHFKLPVDACTTYGIVYDLLKELVTDMYMHVHTENNVLFKRF